MTVTDWWGGKGTHEISVIYILRFFVELTFTIAPIQPTKMGISLLPCSSIVHDLNMMYAHLYRFNYY